MKIARLVFPIALLVASCAPQAAAPTPTPATSSAPTVLVTASPAPTSLTPSVPAAVAVEIPVKGAVMLVLDLTTAVCSSRPTCVASLPKDAALIKKARDAKVPVIYSLTPTAGSTVLPDVAPQAGEPSVTTRADKFFNTNLDQLLKDRGTTNAVMVGTAANGAVLYTAFGANLRGYTVVVAEDGIAADNDFALLLSKWQLLNQPGFTNPDNAPLKAMAVTISSSDKIAFK